jgi:hypothetical protein
MVPPPLPVKHNRDSDSFSQLIEEESLYSSVKAPRGSIPNSTVINAHYELVEIKNREMIAIVDPKTGKKSPPTPPPKPARHSRGSFSP